MNLNTNPPQRFDRDGDGVISWEELYKVVADRKFEKGEPSTSVEGPDGKRACPFTRSLLFESGNFLAVSSGLLAEPTRSPGMFSQGNLVG